MFLMLCSTFTGRYSKITRQQKNKYAIVSKTHHFPYTLHFSGQARMKNLEMDWDLVGNTRF